MKKTIKVITIFVFYFTSCSPHYYSFIAEREQYVTANKISLRMKNSSFCWICSRHLPQNNVDLILDYSIKNNEDSVLVIDNYDFILYNNVFKYKLNSVGRYLTDEVDRYGGHKYVSYLDDKNNVKQNIIIQPNDSIDITIRYVVLGKIKESEFISNRMGDTIKMRVLLNNDEYRFKYIPVDNNYRPYHGPYSY